MTTKTIKFDDDLVREIEAAAQEQNRTFSGYMRHLAIQDLRGRTPDPTEQAALDDYDERRQQPGYKTLSEAEM